MVAKDRTYVPSVPFIPQGDPRRDVAIVYYSRSGHSEAVAREIARAFNAPIARIDAPYPRDFTGQKKAINDAGAGVLPTIRVEPIDLAPTRRLFLVSPTWMFRPATPLWSYVEQTDLTGKEVVLVMTGNSRYKQAGVDAFARGLGRFDVAISLETVEHFPAWHSGKLLRLLAGCAPVIVFSGAQPLQGGVLHVNERPVEHWVQRFGEMGFDLSPHNEAFRADVAALDLPPWYAANVNLFVRRG